MMSPISILSLISFLLIALTLFNKETDVFSPGRLFSLIWLLAIGLTELKFSRYQYAWSVYSWIALLIPLLALLLGIFIVNVINNNNKYPKIIEIRKRDNGSEINSERLFGIVIFLFILYSISYISTFMIRGFVPILTESPEVTRMQWGITGIGTFVLAIPTILYLSFLYLFFAKKKFYKKLLISIVFILSIVSYSMLLNRFYLILSIVLMGVVLYYKTNKLNFRNVLIVSASLGAVFYGISLVRISKYAINILYYWADMKYSSDYAIFTEPYMYIVMNLENYAHAVEKLSHFSYGFFSSDFILYTIGLKKELFNYLHILEYPHMLTNSYNTYSMFFIYYYDFGWFGILIIPLLLGGFISQIYFKMRLRPNLNNISLYGLCVFIVVFSFFIPILHRIHFVFNTVLIFLSTFIIMTKKE